MLIVEAHEGNSGRTALHLAALNGSTSCLNILLENNADVFAKDFHGQMPIHLAAQYGKTNAVILLFEKNASLISAKGSSDKTPLHYAAEYNHLETVKVLINKSANVNVVDSRGRTALHCSAEKGYSNIVKTLLENGADVFAKDNNNNTPACLAAEKGKNGTVDIITEFMTYAANVEDWENHVYCLKPVVNNHTNEEIKSKCLITEDDDINAPIDSENKTALHWAVINGSISCLKVLLKNGADVFAKNTYGSMPIHLAAQFGQLQAVISLIEHNSSLTNVRGPLDSTPLHYAVHANHTEIVKFLINKGSNVNAVAYYLKRTALHLSAEKGYIGILKTLLENGADVFATDIYGYRPIDLAVPFGQLQAVILLFKHSSSLTDARGHNDYTPLRDAVIANQAEIVKFLINEGLSVNAIIDFWDKTALHLSAEKGYISIVKTLLENNADVFSKDFHGQMPIHLAAQYGKTDAIIVLFEKNASLISAKGSSDKTPLHYAAEYNQLETVKVLINKSAYVNVVDSRGRTALHCSAEKSYSNIVKILLENGADLFAKNIYCETPMRVAADNNEDDIVNIFNEYITNISDIRSINSYKHLSNPGRDNQTKADVKTCLIKEDDTANYGRRTSLHLAAVTGSIDCLNLLLENGTNVFAEDRYGGTPIHLAAEFGQLQAVIILIKHNSQLTNVRGCKNFTPLHYAVIANQTEIVKFLINKGANIHAVISYTNTTVLHYAAERNNGDILKILLENGSDVFAKDKDGNMAIHLAAQAGSTNAVRFLAEYNRDLINAKGRNNHTPLYYASTGPFTADSLEKLIDTKKFLLSQGALLN